MADQIVIYGATGYSGKLIAGHLVRLGHKPILAARNPDTLGQLGRRLGLETRTAGLQSDELDRAFRGAAVVLHCAGPFVHTYEQVASACIRNGAHYLDITGEIPVFQGLKGLSDKAKSAGIMLLPGTGFDVVPTDCMAAKVAAQLPTADTLVLAFDGMNGLSRGTINSMLEQASSGSKVLRKGQLVSIPQFSLTRTFFWNGKPVEMAAIPWGDVFTANFSTGIQNIAVYTHIPGLSFMKLSRPFLGIFAVPMFRSAAQTLVSLLVTGPDLQTRTSGEVRLIAIASDPAGQTVEIRYTTPEGYHLTMLSAAECALRAAAGAGRPGFQTPSSAFGHNLLDGITGVKRIA